MPRKGSVAEVARRAGVSTAAPYRHFAGKQVLLMACAVSATWRRTRQPSPGLWRAKHNRPWEPERRGGSIHLRSV
ncbi:helix-turn-helix domain-containing protein [Streptomyces sp. NBC_01012]|uniref:helix-turn-helix domain-containing protein n=1 Tax=Streptomyces sp. NBC_01012 TaxID=2903717 RepID=UPI003870B6DE|nr:TetR/AcrR family transcriptional regulator [Streptomyces sp. NBC_01012]